ncbi:MAG: GAF and ANTAR domain-containing protein [Janthinobacterium lividum]
MPEPRSIRAHEPPLDFAQLVHEQRTETGRLQRGTELAVALVAGCDHAGVTVLTSAFMEAVAASDDVVRRCETWQYELSEGPGLESIRSRTTVVSQDVRTDPRWRFWGPRAAAGLGVRSTMSVLLDLPGDTVGSLTLYSDRTDAWDDEQRGLAQTLGGELARAARWARMLDDRRRTLAFRAEVGQAQGIVMERLGLTADQASDYLRRVSRAHHVKLVHLAEHIVETRELRVLRDEDRPG